MSNQMPLCVVIVLSRTHRATAVVSDLSEISIRLGSELLENFGVARSYEIQSAKLELRQTLARLSQVAGVKREFSGKFSAEQLAASNFVASGLNPSKIVLESGVKVTQGGSSLDLTRVTEEELGVTVCLLPDWSSQDDGYVEADIYASQNNEGELVVVINDFDESAWADVPGFSSDDSNSSSSSSVEEESMSTIE
jgi:hypothetical protein